MLKTLSFILTVLCCLQAAAQREAGIWYFGDRAGIDFSSGSALAISNSRMVAQEGSAVACDKDGSLLFYSNGFTILNRNHQPMDNGLEMDGNTSSTQSVLIVQHPGKDSLYYVFTVDNHAGSKGIRYSIVNIALNNGLGKVTVKNIPLVQNTTEKITAVHHCNNRDIWLLVRLWNSDIYYTFLINKNGLDTDPVPNFTQNKLSGHIWGTLGSMKFAPNSSRIAAAHGWSINYVELANFNRLNGMVVNAEKLYVSPPGFTGFETGPYGIEFSPDSRYLYVYASYGNSKSSIYQFDLQLPTIIDIQNSRALVAELDYPFAGSLQLGPDGKIYVTNSFDSSLSVINQPNNPAATCGFQFGQVQLLNRSSLGLPNFVTSYFDPSFAAGDFLVDNCQSRDLSFRLRNTNEVIGVQWDFGEPSSGAANRSNALTPTHTYRTTGFYSVSLIVTRSCSVDTVIKKVYAGNLTLNLPDQLSSCTGDSMILASPYFDGIQYRWNNGARTNQTYATAPGIYRLTVTAGCTFSDSTRVDFFVKPVFSLGEDRTICIGQQVQLGTGIAANLYQWNTGARTASISVTRTGRYWLTVTDGNSCSYTDTVDILDKPFPTISLGQDTLICETEELVLNPGIRPGTINMVWQDGSQSSTFRVKDPGVYVLKAFDTCTIKYDTIVIKYKTCPLGIPNAFTPNGDGRNDVFRAKYGDGVSDYLLQVFSRTGQRVFESKEQLRGWDGNMGGRAQPAGTYVWMLRYRDSYSGKQVILKGTVNLIR